MLYIRTYMEQLEPTHPISSYITGSSHLRRIFCSMGMAMVSVVVWEALVEAASYVNSRLRVYAFASASGAVCRESFWLELSPRDIFEIYNELLPPLAGTTVAVVSASFTLIWTFCMPSEDEVFFTLKFSSNVSPAYIFSELSE